MHFTGTLSSLGNMGGGGAVQTRQLEFDPQNQSCPLSPEWASYTGTFTITHIQKNNIQHKGQS